MKSILEAKKSLANKIVLIRLDLNVPVKNGKVIHSNRIDKIIPTLNYLIKKNTKLILISHIGRPNGKFVNNLTLKPIFKNLSNQLNQSIKLITKDIYQLNKKNIFESNKDKIVLLENIRFYPEEEINDEKFAKHLASFGDLYVNEAFSSSHR